MAVADRTQARRLHLDVTKPRRLIHIGFNGRFNGSSRRGVLDMRVLRILSEVLDRAGHRITG